MFRLTNGFFYPQNKNYNDEGSPSDRWSVTATVQMTKHGLTSDVMTSKVMEVA